MRRSLRLAIFAPLMGFVTAPLTAATSLSAPWTIGEEREVDEGYYFRLLKVENGWRLWRIESRSGVECRAVKSAKGKPHPIPIGATVNFGLGEPFLLLWSFRGEVRHSWKGPNFDNIAVEVRKPGERFWQNETAGSRLEDGEQLEVNIRSWEYPDIRVGYDETRGTFDLSGLASMSEEVRNCYANRS